MIWLFRRDCLWWTTSQSANGQRQSNCRGSAVGQQEGSLFFRLPFSQTNRLGHLHHIYPISTIFHQINQRCFLSSWAMAVPFSIACQTSMSTLSRSPPSDRTWKKKFNWPGTKQFLAPQMIKPTKNKHIEFFLVPPHQSDPISFSAQTMFWISRWNGAESRASMMGRDNGIPSKTYCLSVCWVFLSLFFPSRVYPLSHE